MMPSLSDDQLPQFMAYLKLKLDSFSDVQLKQAYDFLEKKIAELQAYACQEAAVLEATRSVHPSYAFFDEGSSAYSMWRYGLSVSITNDLDAMHELLKTPLGVMSLATLSTFLIVTSLIAVKYEKDKNSPEYVKYIGKHVTKRRELMKGLKNALKGLQSLFIALAVLGLNLKNTLIPFAVVLGLIAFIDRSLMLDMKENRKVKTQNNDDLLQKIRDVSIFYIKDLQIHLRTSEELQGIVEVLAGLEKQIQSQDEHIPKFGYAGAALGGLIDGLYLYFGLLTLANLSTPVMALMFTLCTLYTLTCILTRVYENYDFELKLQITKTKDLFRITSKKIEVCFAKICLIKRQLNGQTLKEQALVQECEALENEMRKLLQQLKAERSLYTKQTSSNYLSVGLQGLQSGLGAYSALSSFLFVVSTAYVVFGSAIPAYFIVTNVLTGFCILLGSVAYPIYKKSQEIQKPVYDFGTEEANILKATLQEEPDILAFKKALLCILDVLPKEASRWVAFWEMLRSLFSGGGKGEKVMDELGLEQHFKPNQDHIGSHWFILALDLFFALVVGIVMFLKAMAKGFGKEPLDKTSLVDNAEKMALESVQKPPSLSFFAPLPPTTDFMLETACDNRMPVNAKPEDVQIGSTTPRQRGLSVVSVHDSLGKPLDVDSDTNCQQTLVVVEQPKIVNTDDDDRNDLAATAFLPLDTADDCPSPTSTSPHSVYGYGITLFAHIRNLCYTPPRSNTPPVAAPLVF